MCSSDLDIESVRTLWPAVLEAVKSMPEGGRTAWTVFAESVPAAVNGEAITVSLAQQGPFTVARSRNLDDVLAAAVEQVVRRPLRIDLVLDPGAKAAAPEPAPEAPKRAPSRARTKADPAPTPTADTPSVDDENADDDLRGIELAKHALGGIVIAETGD